MQEEKKGSSTLIWAVVVVIIALGGFYGYKYMNSSSGASNTTPVTVPDTTTAVTEVKPAVSTLQYKDGSYSAVGDYFSPEGSESIAVSLTLKDDVVTDANVVSQATRRESKQYQAKFISGYKALVVGKKIEDIALTKVSGSSLTPKGFMDAITKIETQAKA